jgi:hypothetical protein
VRAAWIPFTALAATAACSGSGPNLTFEHYRRNPPNELGTYEREMDFDAAGRQVDIRTKNQVEFVIEYTAVLSGAALDALDAATDELEAEWDPPYECNECITMESFRFVVDGNPDDVAFVRFNRGSAPTEAQDVVSVIDELFVQIGGCLGGPYVWSCVRVE